MKTTLLVCLIAFLVICETGLGMAGRKKGPNRGQNHRGRGNRRGEGRAPHHMCAGVSLIFTITRAIPVLHMKYNPVLPNCTLLPFFALPLHPSVTLISTAWMTVIVSLLFLVFRILRKFVCTFACVSI